jgi:hypothetical protein
MWDTCWNEWYFRRGGSMTDESKQTRRDIRRAIIFGVVAATLEMAVLLYFFR